MQPGSVKKTCGHWLSGTCKQDDMCVFLHGQESHGFLNSAQTMRQLQLSNAALQESMNMKTQRVVLAQQQMALNTMMSQGGGLLQRQGPGLMQRQGPGLMQPQGPGLVQPQGPGMMQPQGPGMMQPQGPGMMQPQGPGMMQPRLMSIPMVRQQVPGLQQTFVMNPVDILQQRQQAMLANQAVLGGQFQTLEYGDEDDDLQVSDGDLMGFRRKRKSRFHDSNEILTSARVQGQTSVPPAGLMGLGLNQTLMNAPGAVMMNVPVSRPALSPVGIGLTSRPTLQFMQAPMSRVPGAGMSSVGAASLLRPEVSGQIGGHGLSPAELMDQRQMFALQSQEFDFEQNTKIGFQVRRSRFDEPPTNVQTVCQINQNYHKRRAETESYTAAETYQMTGAEAESYIAAQNYQIQRAEMETYGAKQNYKKLRAESEMYSARQDFKKPREETVTFNTDKRATQAESKYEPDNPTEDDDLVDDFVDKILSGSHPKIIQPEDKSKKKGISFKNVFVSTKQKEKSLQSVPVESEYQMFQHSHSRNQKPERDSWGRPETTYQFEKEDNQFGDVFDYHHKKSDFVPEPPKNFPPVEQRDEHLGRSERVYDYGTEHPVFRNADQLNSYQLHKGLREATLANESWEVSGIPYGAESNMPRLTPQGQRLYHSSVRHEDQFKRTDDPGQLRQTVGVSNDQDDQTYTEQRSRADLDAQRSRKKLGGQNTAEASNFFDNPGGSASTSKTKTAKSDSELGVNSPREIQYGENLPDFIVKFMKNAGKYKHGVLCVTKSYKLPANCIGLTPPKMNTDAWEILTKKAQTRDELLQDLQRWFASGVIPLIKQVDFFGKGSKIMKDVIRYTSDALNVMSYVCNNMSIKRRLLIRNSVHKKYGILCRVQQPVSEFLFGDNLVYDLLAAKAGTFEIPEAEKKSQDQNNDDPEGENFKPTFFAGLALPDDEIDESVAGIINMACANDGDVSDLREKYKLPTNCTEVIPPKINPEMWSLVSRSGLELDYRLQDVQLSIAEAITPLMLLLQSVHEKKYHESHTITLLTDSLLLLGNAMYQLNKVRLDAMRRSLPEQVHGYCGFFWPGANQVSVEKLTMGL